MLARRLLDRDLYALVSEAMEADGFLVAFTERTGGASDGPFRSLNLGLATKDVPAMVFENRRRVASVFGLDRIAAVRQRHGAAVVAVEGGRSWSGYSGRRRQLPDGDGLATSSQGLGLVILTADCVPIALADPRTGRLAAVHAGWRGIAAGVVGTALAGFEDPARVHAAIGPSVGVDHYEVGEDVAGAVIAASPDGASTTRRGARIHLDLPDVVGRILRARGVRRIEMSGLCTACEPGRFFSYRRDGETGRQALVAARR